MRIKEIGLTFILLVLLSTNSAHANPRGTGSSNPGDKLATYGASDCQLCHAGSTVKNAYGPHGGYTATSDKCKSCHVIHNVPGSGRTAFNSKLLVGETVTDTCQFCHDLTASDLAPYSTTRMTNPSDAKSAHRIRGLTAYNGVFDNWLGYSDIPGGNQATGGSSTLNVQQGELSGAQLTCNSCHTPHGLSTIQPYLGESAVKASTSDDNVQPGSKVFYLTSRLLKSKLLVGETVYSSYGSSWCAGCHQGRLHTTGDGNFNHPVNQNSTGYDWGAIAEARGILVNSGTPEDVNSGTEVVPAGQKPIAVLVYDMEGSQTTPVWVKMFGVNGLEDLFVMPKVNADPRSNMWYTMTGNDAISGNARHDGYRAITEYPEGPACQQCHSSARDIEQAFSVGVNPEVLSFPHISKNESLLVEDNDDLCTNCHGVDNLP